MLYKPGTYINHTKFGIGLILETTVNEKEYRLYVSFKVFGKKYIKINENDIFLKENNE